MIRDSDGNPFRLHSYLTDDIRYLPVIDQTGNFAGRKLTTRLKLNGPDGKYLPINRIYPVVNEREISGLRSIVESVTGTRWSFFNSVYYTAYTAYTDTISKWTV